MARRVQARDTVRPFTGRRMRRSHGSRESRARTATTTGCADLVAGRQARDLRALDTGIRPRVCSHWCRHRRAAEVRSSRRARTVTVLGVVRELVAVPGQSGLASSSRGLRSSAVCGLRTRLGGWTRALGPGGMGDTVRGRRRPLRRVRSQACRRLLPVADWSGEPSSPRMELSPRCRR